MDSLLISPPDRATADRPFEGKEIAIAGRLLSLTRSEAVQFIASHAGIYSPQVTKRTRILVLGQDGRFRREFFRACDLQRRGQPLELIPEDDFLRQCGRTEQDGKYTVGELVQMLGVSRDRLRGWIRARLVQPAEVVGTLAYFCFSEVTAVKLLCELTQAGISIGQLRRCVSQLERWMPNTRQAISRLDLIEGRLLVWRKGGQPADVTGQLLFDFAEHESESVSVCWSTAIPAQPLDSAADPEELFQRALSLEETEEFAEAAAVYGRWLLEHGPASRICFNLGNVLSALGGREAAIERYRQAVELDPCYAEAWNNLGNLLADRDEMEAAIAAWRRAVEADPDCSEALYNLADALQSSQQIAEAQRYWKAYLEHDRESDWADYARLCLSRDVS